MAQSVSNGTGKKLVQIDVSSDSVCPWCFVGKRNLDKAIAASKDQYDFEIKWHPFFLNPSAPKEGINKREYYVKKFGPRAEMVTSRMTEVFRGLGLEYNMSGLTGNTLDSHRLIYFAGQQGLDKQHNLVEELFLGYFTQGNYIGDREFLLESARKVGVEGAAEFLEDPGNGLKEAKKLFPNETKYSLCPLKINEELEKYPTTSGVPNYMINGKQQVCGGQPPEVFLRAFQAATN